MGSKTSGLNASIKHEMKKFDDGIEICCREKEKESYGVIYFIHGTSIDNVSENEICKICGKKLKE